MSHPDFVRPSGQWPPELVPTAADYQRWDVLQTKLINGDDGGTWNPTKPIILGGAGGALVSAGSQLTGGATTQTGGTMMLGISASDFPGLSPSRTRTIQCPVVGAQTHVDLGAAPGSDLDEAYFGQSFGSGAIGITVQRQSGFAAPTLYIEIPPRHLHNGARIATVAIQYQLLQKVAIPAITLSMGILEWAIGTVVAPTNPFTIPVWSPSTAKTPFVYVSPLAVANQNGLYFRSTGFGTTGTTEPAWTSVVGSTVSDGSVTWTCIGRSGLLATANATIDTYYNNGAAQTLAFDTDLTGGNIVDTTNNRALIFVSNLDPSTVGVSAPVILVTGAYVVFDTITSLSFQ